MLSNSSIGGVIGSGELLSLETLRTLPTHVILTCTALNSIHHRRVFPRQLAALIFFDDLVVSLDDLGCLCVDAVVIMKKRTTARVHLPWVRRHERYIAKNE